MYDGIESRLIIHEILKLIRNKSNNFDETFNLITINKNLNIQNKKFIHNTILTTLRHKIIIDKIINNIVNKIDQNNDSYLLLLSSISQILFLNIKEYAVVYSTVEISKKNKINSSPKFINGCLRRIIRNKNIFLKTKVEFKDLPEWFIEKTKNLSDRKKNILIKNIFLQPSLHLVFKKKKYIKKYIKFGKITSDRSIAVGMKYNFADIPNFKNGEWWIQDYLSMLPLSLINIKKYKNIADVGSAPGGKLFQLMSSQKKITSFEKNKNRSNILIKNLKRLKFNITINIKDFLETKNIEKFDLIILDAPCSAVGTIRRHPEIFFKKIRPNFDSLIKNQYKLLQKSAKLLKNNGMIIYMVCSFLEIETIKQIEFFLQNNKNFTISRFDQSNNISSKDFINKQGAILTIPNTILKDVKVDGYFACKLIKNDN